MHEHLMGESSIKEGEWEGVLNFKFERGGTIFIRVRFRN